MGIYSSSQTNKIYYNHDTIYRILLSINLWIISSRLKKNENLKGEKIDKESDDNMNLKGWTRFEHFPHKI